MIPGERARRERRGSLERQPTTGSDHIAFAGEAMPELSGISEKEMMSHNRAWINQQMDEGRTIVDLGPDPMRKYYSTSQASSTGRSELK